MKTITFLCAYFVSILTFSGCNKCQTCTETVTTSVNVQVPGYPQVSKTTYEACGEQLKAVNGKTTTATSTVDGITATVTSKTTCN
jgi:hypothetical protein